MKVRELLGRQPVTVDVATTIAHAAHLLGSAGVGALVVVDGDRPVGMVTDRDIVLRGIARGVPTDARIDALMTMGLTSINADADLDDLLEVFGSNAVRRVPVMDGERLVGIVTLDDMLVWFSTRLGDLTRGLTAQLLFPHAGDEAAPPATH
jgi:CBS domain-containing protein